MREVRVILLALALIATLTPAMGWTCNADVVLKDGYTQIELSDGSYATISNASVLAALYKASEICNLSLNVVNTSWGLYVEAIGNVSAQGTAGWMYVVNGEMPPVGAADYILKDGDQVVFFYGSWGVQPNSSEYKVIINVSFGENIPDSVDDYLEKLVGKYNPSFDWKNDTPSIEDIRAAILKAILIYIKCPDESVKLEILRLITLYIKFSY